MIFIYRNYFACFGGLVRKLLNVNYNPRCFLLPLTRGNQDRKSNCKNKPRNQNLPFQTEGNSCPQETGRTHNCDRWTISELRKHCTQRNASNAIVRYHRAGIVTLWADHRVKPRSDIKIADTVLIGYKRIITLWYNTDTDYRYYQALKEC